MHLQGPIEVFAHFAIRTSEDYYALQRNQTKPGKEIHMVDEPVEAFVNHGRWLVDCACRNSCAASRTWGIALCICGCGAIFTQVVFPPNADQIEAALLALGPEAVQHWVPVKKGGQ